MTSKWKCWSLSASTHEIKASFSSPLAPPPLDPKGGRRLVGLTLGISYHLPSPTSIPAFYYTHISLSSVGIIAMAAAKQKLGDMGIEGEGVGVAFGISLECSLE